MMSLLVLFSRILPFVKDGITRTYSRFVRSNIRTTTSAVVRKSVVVCVFGTAFTAAVVTADRVWRGGVIAPGFPLMRDYLFERTAKLPRMTIGGKCPKIGRSTEEAMRFGALVGYRGMVREIVGELERNFGLDFRLVATGGFAKWVLKDIGMDFTVDQTLTLHGAGLIASWIFEREDAQ